MKKTICALLSTLLLLSFAGCKKDETPTTTRAAETTALVTETQPSTQESTSAQKTDISFIYEGYWYKNDGNKVLALKFEKDGTLIVHTYRRKNIASGENAPDTVVYGSYSDQGDGTIYVYPDNDFKDQFSVYLADSGAKSLTDKTDDPEMSMAINTPLIHRESLDKAIAREVYLSDN